MTPILLSLVSAASFGAMTVLIRTGLRGGDAAAGAVATLLPALVIGVVAALPRHDLSGAWPFLLAGLLAPGCSQVLFTLAIREVGASRTSVAAGAAPLVTVSIALVFLDEPLRLPLALGALAIVGGGVLLAAERDRPDHFRALGLLFAAGACVAFAVRDNIARAMHTDATPETALAATLLGGVIATLIYARRAPSATEVRRLAPAGTLLGISYLCLFEAYFRAEVSVVAPLVATESLWGVGISVLAFGATEGVGARLVLGAALVVAGGVLIGIAA
jgi:drug/metabolite transporter (DMT)-like permease